MYRQAALAIILILSALSSRLSDSQTAKTEIGVGRAAVASQQKLQGSAAVLVFEVASVKLHAISSAGRAGRNPETDSARMWRTPARITIQAMTAVELIELAYGIASGDRIEGKPDWASQLRFDIIGTTSSPSNAAQQNAMLQALLVERFGLKFHRGTKRGQVYSISRGQKMSLTEAKESEDTEVARFLPSLVVNNDGSSDLAYSVKHVSLPELAYWLSSVLNATVSDNTELKGSYDFNLRIAGAPPRAPGEPDTFHRLNPNDFVTAVRKQLGLRLEARSGFVEMLVIDSMHKPTPN